MNHKKVSVIIPLYNHEKFIIETIESVVNDTYPSKEIVVINDGSKDRSDIVVREWIKINNKISVNYLSRENKGLTKTLNELIDRSTGDYILLLGSDDYLINNTIQDRVSILESNKDKLMLISDAIVIDSDGKKIYESGNFNLQHGNKQNYLSDRGLKKEIVKNWSVVGPVVMMDRKLFDLIGNYDESLYFEDWDFYLRAVSKNLVIYFDQQVSAYRLHNSNMSTSKANGLKMWECGMLTAKKNIKNFGFPYNFWLWKKYRRAKRKYTKLLKELESAK